MEFGIFDGILSVSHLILKLAASRSLSFDEIDLTKITRNCANMLPRQSGINYSNMVSSSSGTINTMCSLKSTMQTSAQLSKATQCSVSHLSSIVVLLIPPLTVRSISSIRDPELISGLKLALGN